MQISKFLLIRLITGTSERHFWMKSSKRPSSLFFADEPVDASTKQQVPIILSRNGTLKAKAPEDPDVVSYHSDWWKEALEMEEKVGVEHHTMGRVER